MPGLAVLAGSGALAAAERVRALLMRDGYASGDVVPSRDRLGIVYAAPRSYPIVIERAGGATAALEGAVYGRSAADVGRALRDLAEAYARDPSAARTAAERFALQTDGDFAIVLVDASATRALVVNDRLGRLPLYFASAGGAAAIAREVKAVRSFVGAGDVDRHGIAQLLMFSFPLGARTLHEGIARLTEASSAAIDGERGTIDVRRYARWNFEALAESGDQPTADELADTFVDRCAALGAWAAGRPMVVAMSGGLDSRSTAAGLVKAGYGFDCVTFESGRKGATEETETANEIADVLGAHWRLYELDRPTWSDSARLAERCDGTTNVGMAFMEPFFARLRAEFGDDVVQLTGDGGDRALPDLRERSPRTDRDAFVARRIEGALWPLATVAALLRLEPEDIVAHVREHVGGYPERSPAYWGVRYLIADYGWGRIFSGEDRSRSFAWTMTPFYCQSFFDAAMRVPQKAKRDYALYADFLRALDDRVSSVKKSNWGYAPTSLLVRMQGVAAAIRDGTPDPLRKALGSLRRSRSNGVDSARTRSAEFSSAVRQRPNDVFDPDVLEDIAERGCGKTHYHMLQTALLYVDAVWRERAPAAP